MGKYLHNQYAYRALIDELLSTSNADLLDDLNQAQLKELIMQILLLMRHIKRN